MPIKTICPVCDQDITLDPEKLRHAVVHLGETNGQLVIGCPNCCRVLVVPDIPPGVTEVQVQEIINQIVQGDPNDWLNCLPLPVQLVQEPNGVIDYQGEKLYQPGDGSAGLRKYAYMAIYGVDPECMWAKMKSGKK